MGKSAKAKKASGRLRAAAICTPGLESVCMDELRALGVRPKSAGPGTVEFDATHRQVYAANVWLRTASRIVVRVATFRATDWIHLQDHAAVVDWARWVPNGHAPSFRISSNDSKLYHTKAIAQRLHQVSLPPSIGEPEQQFVVRIERNTVTISADASGEALHKRPWRTELGEAPLRATMAAAMLLLAEWDPSVPLIDPFCGAGTVAIEAALLARGLPPGGERNFAFQQWPDFQPGAWASVQGTVSAARRAAASKEGPHIVASDRDGVAVSMTAANAARAEVADCIEVEKRLVSHLRARAGHGLVATNPPYGRRMGADRLHGLYRRLGAVVRERLPDFELVVLTSDARLARAADRGCRSLARFRHGGLPVEVFHRTTIAAEADGGGDVGDAEAGKSPADGQDASTTVPTV